MATIDKDRLDRIVLYSGVGWARHRGAMSKAMPVAWETYLFCNYIDLYIHRGSFLADGGEAS